MATALRSSWWAATTGDRWGSGAGQILEVSSSSMEPPLPPPTSRMHTLFSVDLQKFDPDTCCVHGAGGSRWMDTNLPHEARLAPREQDECCKGHCVEKFLTDVTACGRRPLGNWGGVNTGSVFFFSDKAQPSQCPTTHRLQVFDCLTSGPAPHLLQ